MASQPNQVHPGLARPVIQQQQQQLSNGQLQQQTAQNEMSQHLIPNGTSHSPPQQQQQQQVDNSPAFQNLQSTNAECWLAVGKLAEVMGDFERAVMSYEASLRHSPNSIPILTAIANLYRSREMFEKAVEYYQSILYINKQSGETWGSLGACFLIHFFYNSPC
jgi:tetratricopeptide (TPR) repeat protein